MAKPEGSPTSSQSSGGGVSGSTKPSPKLPRQAQHHNFDMGADSIRAHNRKEKERMRQILKENARRLRLLEETMQSLSTVVACQRSSPSRFTMTNADEVAQHGLETRNTPEAENALKFEQQLHHKHIRGQQLVHEYDHNDGSKYLKMSLEHERNRNSDDDCNPVPSSLRQHPRGSVPSPSHLKNLPQPLQSQPTHQEPNETARPQPSLQQQLHAQQDQSKILALCQPKFQPSSHHKPHYRLPKQTKAETHPRPESWPGADTQLQKQQKQFQCQEQRQQQHFCLPRLQKYQYQSHDHDENPSDLHHQHQTDEEQSIQGLGCNQRTLERNHSDQKLGHSTPDAGHQHHLNPEVPIDQNEHHLSKFSVVSNTNVVMNFSTMDNVKASVNSDMKTRSPRSTMPLASPQQSLSTQIPRVTPSKSDTSNDHILSVPSMVPGTSSLPTLASIPQTAMSSGPTITALHQSSLTSPESLNGFAGVPDPSTDMLGSDVCSNPSFSLDKTIANNLDSGLPTFPPTSTSFNHQQQSFQSLPLESPFTSNTATITATNNLHQRPNSTRTRPSWFGVPF